MSQGRRVFVTGGSRGIGRSIAEKFRSEGHIVLAPSRQELDLSSPEKTIQYLAKNPLDVDVLIHCAGINILSPVERITQDNWVKIIDTNLTAALLLIQAAMPFMVSRRWGRIACVSSIYSLLTRDERAAYGVSKAGLNSLIRTTALEHAHNGVIANAICPGFVDTDMTKQNNTPRRVMGIIESIPLGRLAAESEIAEIVAFVCSDRNTYLTGQALVVDGGFSLQ